MPDHRGAGAFWDFSLAFYALPDVADACIALQERNGVDVNVLLYMLFRARARSLLAPADIAAVDALARPWRETVVVPLRGVRRALKAAIGAVQPAASSPLRDDVKRCERAAERLQQHMLESSAPAGSPAAAGTTVLACARTHVDAYARMLGGLDAAAAERILEAFAQSCALSGHGDGGHDTIGTTT
jgi:uncharacterized protein (TIGR02444 family)